MTVTFMRISSWGELEFLRASRRVGFPAAAAGAAPVELARLETAGFAAIARKAPGVAVHEIAHELQIPLLVGRTGGEHLRLEPAVEAEQRRVPAQLVAHQLVRFLVPLCLERVLEYRVEKIERRIALEITGQQAQPFLGAARFAVRLVHALRGEREIRRVLRLDALPVLDRALHISRVFLQITELQARAHAFTVGVEGGFQMLARSVRPRLSRFRGGELAVVLRQLARVGADLPGHLDGAGPVLLLFVDLQQMRARRRRLRAVFQLLEHFLSAIEDAGLQVVLPQLGERDHALLLRQVGALQQVLVHADCAVILAAPAKETAEGEVQLDRLGIDLHHFDERLDRLVGLLVQQEVEALEIRARQGARLVDDLADVDARGGPSHDEEERQREQPPPFELHLDAHVQSSGTGGRPGSSGGTRFLRSEISRRWRSSGITSATTPNSAPAAKNPKSSTTSGAWSARSK